MKVNLSFLSHSLFRGSAYYLDLDTGETCSEYLIREGLSKQPQHYVALPRYSEAPIYREYLNMVFSMYSIEDTLGLSKYPEFDPIINPTDDLVIEYIDKAYYFTMYDLPAIIHNSPHLTEEQKQTIPTYGDYYHTYTLQFAKNWCKKEGYEWFEE